MLILLKSQAIVFSIYQFQIPPYFSVYKHFFSFYQLQDFIIVIPPKLSTKSTSSILPNQVTNSLTSVHLISPQHENHLLEIIASPEFLITIPTFFHYVHFTGFLYFLLNISIFWLISARIIQDQMDILFLIAINPDCLSISNNLTMSYFYNFI